MCSTWLQYENRLTQSLPPLAYSPLSPSSDILQDAVNALVILLVLRVFMGDGEHLLSGGLHARLPLDNVT
ncbi:hypothetical protein EVAR_8846_1 [Eumeta japonica]|uniref:Uncharacterized protein n=1 Tax=Eumeta variegata TaxID=151549 RepID=A0A4C1TUB5_EUMVA|nr:hypothetical protein EVAR_8846_1 [Eumeta japonica]